MKCQCIDKMLFMLNNYTKGEGVGEKERSNAEKVFSNLSHTPRCLGRDHKRKYLQNHEVS